MSLLYERILSWNPVHEARMKKKIDQLSTLLEHNNISILQGEKKSDAGQLKKIMRYDIPWR